MRKAQELNCHSGNIVHVAANQLPHFSNLLIQNEYKQTAVRISESAKRAGDDGEIFAQSLTAGYN
jgi:hypothetical protein